MAVLTHSRYTAGAVLGRGAQGVVARVVDAEAPRRALVAKVWSRGAFSEELLAGEFALLVRVRVPGLVRAHDLCRDEVTGAPFFVEDYVDGSDAGQWIAAARDDAERVGRLAQLLANVASTLSGLHEAGFVHGDLKPAHVRVPSEGRAVVLDLGAAVARGGAETNAVGLTPEYAAPEVLAGARPTPASDLFSLGALAWSVATGGPPVARGDGEIRRRAPWVPPSLASPIQRLLCEHPQDRPRDARDVLRLLGEAAPTLQRRAVERGRWATPSPAGREATLTRLLETRSGVHYVVGAPGSGKSHLLREATVRALLGGRDSRRVVFPTDDSALTRGLIAFFRGADDAWPFKTRPGALLLALDGLEAAPEELAHALEAFRCRPGSAPRVHVLASVRAAPEGAPSVHLEPLGDDVLGELCAELGVDDAEHARQLVRQADGNVGWLVAAIGKVPLDSDAARERLKRLNDDSRLVLAAVALAGGEASEALCARVTSRHAAAIGELLAAGLLTRRAAPRGGTAYALATPGLGEDIAQALGSFEVVDRVASAMLEADSVATASELLAVAGAQNPPERRAELLRAAVDRARVEGLRSVEMEALLALAADVAERTPDVLLALDRVTRGGGSAGLHPELVTWLEDAAARDSSLGPLALRRRAEQRARAGDFEDARAIAERARELAQDLRDPGAEALALSTLGSIALYRADWAAAEEAVGEAVARIASGGVDDVEEIARLDHNRGVVALYRERVDEATAAFERSLEAKRAMGDRGGVWACLVNLGLAFGKAERYAAAERAFDEAFALTRSMGQPGGTGWCLAAQGEVAVKRGDAELAERCVAEARRLGDALPASVRADLDLVSVEAALLEGDGAAALERLSRLGAEARADDALTDARALTLESRALLMRLPVDRHLAARVAIAAIRRARAGRLPEVERSALEALAAARGSRAEPPSVQRPPPPEYDGDVAKDAEVWRWLEALASGQGTDEAAHELARLVVDQSCAERAFVAVVDPGGAVVRAWGADVDGIAVEQPERRLEAQTVELALGRDAPIYRRDVETRASRGSRLAVATPSHPDRCDAQRGVVVAEHRFIVGRFDDVSEDVARSWATLAGLLAGRSGGAPSKDARITPVATRPSVPAERPVGRVEATTALPALSSARAFPEIVGKSPALRAALARLDSAVDSDLPVLIVGETGVGKERFARAVHDYGPRASGPFVAVSCAAIPETLFEAELFGHARGSFTGADRSRPGLIARAQGGTLFLDEVGELPLSRQAVLLRALESRTFRPVGADQEKPFDVRIVAATNRDLGESVRTGAFRQDLLYRLNVLEIRDPSAAPAGGGRPGSRAAFPRAERERGPSSPPPRSAPSKTTRGPATFASSSIR